MIAKAELGLAGRFDDRQDTTISYRVRGGYQAAALRRRRPLKSTSSLGFTETPVRMRREPTLCRSPDHLPRFGRPIPAAGSNAFWLGRLRFTGELYSVVADTSWI
jgi:hypothetical protein